MKYIKLFESFSSEEFETESIADLKMKLIDLLNKKFNGPYCTLESDPQNENLFTIKHCSKKRWSYPGQIEPSIECEIKPYESKGREGYPNYVLYLKSDIISKGMRGPWSFREDELYYIVDVIFEFLIHTHSTSPK